MKYNWDKQKVEEVVSQCTNYSDALRSLGVPIRGNNIATLKRKIRLYGISTKHFTGRVYQKDFGNVKYKSADNYLNTTNFINSWKLKEKLIKEGIKEHRCEICGLTEWMGRPIPLQLHHINGDNADNRIENLHIICPNCHAQTDNYRGSANRMRKAKHCPDCGAVMSRESKYCHKCSALHRVKLAVPKDVLLKDYQELKSYVQVARKYGVSDKTIKKKLSK